MFRLYSRKVLKVKHCRCACYAIGLQEDATGEEGALF